MQFFNEKSIKIEWHKDWDDDVESALATLPRDPLAERELLRLLWDFHVTKIPLKAGIVKTQNDEIVGFVPLKRRGRSAWQLLTYYCMPYCKLMVQPDYVDETLRQLARDVDCPNIACPSTPSPTSYLRPEKSWVIDTSKSYSELMHERKYAQEDRRTRRKSAQLTIIHDRFDSLPVALDQWHQTWMHRGSEYTAVAYDEMKVVCDYMIETGRLKTISAYDHDRFVGMNTCMVYGEMAYGTFLTAAEDYRELEAGIRLILEGLDWACGSGIKTFDTLRSSGLPKHRWGNPCVVGYRLVRCPLGSTFLGEALGKVKDITHKWRNEKVNRRHADSNGANPHFSRIN